MSIKTLTGTALLLALALVSQSLRLLIPLPNTVSMFLIGTLVGICLVTATLRYGTGSGVIIACVTPVVAFLQGMLPLMPFIPVVAMGNIVFVLLAYAMARQSVIMQAIVCAVGKEAVMYGGFSLLFMAIALPASVEKALLFVMSWPQIVTGFLAVLITRLIIRRV